MNFTMGKKNEKKLKAVVVVKLKADEMTHC
jgi:hypothetical protein